MRFVVRKICETFNMSFARALLPALLFLVTRFPDTNQQQLHKIPITCDAGDFTAGKSASVTCNFFKDMNDDRRGINVVRYPFNATEDEPGTQVLACEWKETYHCNVEKGYIFDTTITDRLIVRISTVSEGYRGLYRCLIEPAGETETHACEFDVKYSYRAVPPAQDEGESRHVLSIVIPVVVLGLIIIIIIIVVYTCCPRRLPCKKRQHDTPQNAESSIPMLESRPNRPTYQLKLDEFMKGLKLTESDYQNVMELMAQNLGNSQGSVKACTVPVHSLPDGTCPSMRTILTLNQKKEESTCLVVELGITKVTICRVVLGFQTDIEPQETYCIPPDIRRGTGLKLFSFIADCMNQFLVDYTLCQKRFRLGFIFPFPWAQDQGLTKATITEWSKGFDCSDVVGKDVGELLQQALNENITDCNLHVRTVCNDAIGTLIAVASDDPSCRIAVMLGSGFNACCMQENINSCVELTKTELGMLGENKSLERFTTKYDREVDGCSMHPGKHVLEKMVSMVYIGEVVRSVLKTLTENDLLFHTVQNKPNFLTVEGALTSDFVSLVESDTSKGYLATEVLLKQLHVENYTEVDCRIVVDVCQVVLKRAAYLGAAGLAALINYTTQTEVKDNNQQQVTIAVEGDVHRYHPNFFKLLVTKACQLVKPELKLKIYALYYGSTIGTALVTSTFPKPVRIGRNSDKVRRLTTLKTESC